MMRYSCGRARRGVAVSLVAGAAAGLWSSPAFAAPRESITFTNVVSEGDLESGVNQVRTHTFAGGYQVGRVRITATQTALTEFQYALDATIRVTPPGGTPIDLVPFPGIQDGFGTITATDLVIRLDPIVTNSTGVWTFQFYEDIVDADAGPDANWTSFQITLDDDVTPGPGDLPATALALVGSGPLTSIADTLSVDGRAHMYKIQICEPANFSASTIGGTTVDTQLYLFNESGVGVAYSDEADDLGQSRISNAFTASLPQGNYYLAVSEWDVTALDSSGQRLWNDMPWDVERAPDGPGAANPVAAWEADTGAGGSYTITLTGACFVGPSFSCPADLDNGSGTGTPDGGVTIDDLIFFLIAFEVGSTDADLDNGTGTGTVDGAVTVDDLLFFLGRFDAGC